MRPRRKQGIGRSSPVPAGRLGDFSAKFELPPAFLERLPLIQIPMHVRQTLDALRCHKYVSFRVHRLRGEIAETLEQVVAAGISFRKVTWMLGAGIADPEMRGLLTHSPMSDEGRIYVQGLSSMLAASLLQVSPGETVLDLAASPGGKCTLLADQMTNQGILSAVEVVRPRMFRLQRVLKQYGVTIARTYLKDGRTVGHKTPGRFDRVLLDAPCSSEGRFHVSRPESWQFWSPRKIQEQARKQVGLLRSAFRALKPGGRLLYCTCSLAPEENECVVSTVLKDFGDSIEVLPLPWPPWHTPESFPRPVIAPGLIEWNGKKLDPRLQAAARIIPDAYFEGFFVALLGKSPVA